MVPSFIYHSEQAQKTLAALLKRRVPIVGMMSEQGEVSDKIDRVISDYRDTTTEIMSHLISLRHRRIGFIYGIAVPELGSDRMDAYRESLEGAGITIDSNLVVECGHRIIPPAVRRRWLGTRGQGRGGEGTCLLPGLGHPHLHFAGLSVRIGEVGNRREFDVGDTGHAA